MIHEIAMIEVIRGSESAFELAVAEAATLFKSAKGCRSLRLERSIEAPTHYRLVVGWESVEDHEIDFRNSDAFQRWRALAAPHFAAPPIVEHVDCVLQAF